MKKLVFFLSILLFFSEVQGQIAPGKYFVKFTDKNNSPYSINNPSEYLSQRAIDRRVRQNIPIVESDLPVNPSYLQGVAATGVNILNPTKWLNGVTVQTDDTTLIDVINSLPYVAGVTKYPSGKIPAINPDFKKPFFAHEKYDVGAPLSLKQGSSSDSYDYGNAYNQAHMLKVDQLHDLGYRGQGMVIAILDAGFTNADSIPAFDSIWQDNRVLGTWDFVESHPITFDKYFHGTMVFSTIGGNSPGNIIGTAPEASFYLIRTEDANSENIIEEYNWVSGAEYADSVGADVINSSLGYTQFDNGMNDHTYEDMNGHTCPSSRGAAFAASKGILVCNSLGNEGDASWYYLSAPSDADSILGVGAVDESGNYASFSSHGPSSDGRVKPDVVAQGSGSWIADPYGNYYPASGTSFSSPITAGAVACLWQSRPLMTNMQIRQAIIQSASQYQNPDDFLGYGIPDYMQARGLLTVVENNNMNSFQAEVYPNPFVDKFFLSFGNVSDQKISLEITDLTGRLIWTKDMNISKSRMQIDALNGLDSGIYFLKISSGNSIQTLKLIKK